MFLAGVLSILAVGLDVEQLTDIMTRDGSLKAPVVELVRDRLNAAALGSADTTPVVFMHGMGDAGPNPGMQSLARTVTELYPGKYSVALSVADGIASILEPMDRQLAEFTAAIRADPKLQNGFDAVGLSQGNLVVRAYIERVNCPPVRRFVSICGPMEGVGTCPSNPLYELVCPIWKLDKYAANIAFSAYWKGVTDKSDYLEHNVFLPDINNERLAKNATYRENMLRLDQYVLVEGLFDTMLVPRQTSQHGFWPWGKEYGHLVPMEKSEGYVGDWIGLRTLDKLGRLHKLSYRGDHLRFTSEWWSERILPIFA
jgi:palmitoyl-protein thioesterase